MLNFHWQGKLSPWYTNNFINRCFSSSYVTVTHLNDATSILIRIASSEKPVLPYLTLQFRPQIYQHATDQKPKDDIANEAYNIIMCSRVQYHRHNPPHQGVSVAGNAFQARRRVAHEPCYQCYDNTCYESIHHLFHEITSPWYFSGYILM